MTVILDPTFTRPGTIPEAIASLQAFGDGATVLAGGTALVLLMRQRLAQPTALVSIDGLTEPEVRSVEVHDDQLHIGALVTHREVSEHPTVRQRIPILADAFGAVGNVRVRNVGTVGGVLAEADYASDPPAVLRMLGATVILQGPGGERRIPIDQFLTGLYQTALERGELVTAVTVPLSGPCSAAVYKKVITRSSEDRPCIGVAAGVELQPDGTIARLRVAVGAATPIPQRFPDIEETANGEVPSQLMFEAIGRKYAARIDAIDDLRASSWYRKRLAQVWIARVLTRAHSLVEGTV